MKLTADEMAINLRIGWDMTTPLQRYRGLNWYPEANDFAWVIGKGDVRKAAGWIAAMSPQKAWDNNRLLAVNISMGIFGGQVANAVAKARAIYEGADPADVLPMHKKTGHFFMNILDPNNPDYVTVDRHAIRAATLDWDNGAPVVTDKQYRETVLAYQMVASDVGVSPSAFQATIWGWARAR